MVYWLIKYISNPYGYKVDSGKHFNTEKEARDYAKNIYGNNFSYYLIRVNEKEGHCENTFTLENTGMKI